MNRPSDLKPLMQLNKGYLSNLYSQNKIQNIRTLGGSSETQLRLVLKLLYCLCHGIIPLKTEFGQALVKNGKATRLQADFGTQTKLRNLLKSPRQNKFETLSKYAGIFPSLFYL